MTSVRRCIDRLLIWLWTWSSRPRVWAVRWQTDRALRRIIRRHQRLEQQELARARLEMAAQLGDRRAQLREEERNTPSMLSMKSGLPKVDRKRLAKCIGELGDAIAKGECVPTALELKALAQVCDEHQLPMEAARVRRWMNAMTREQA